MEGLLSTGPTPSSLLVDFPFNRPFCVAGSEHRQEKTAEKTVLVVVVKAGPAEKIVEKKEDRLGTDTEERQSDHTQFVPRIVTEG